MRNFLFKLLSAFCIVFSLKVTAQLYPEGVSDGRLIVDNQTVPVKIFSTTNYSRFSDFPNEETRNALVIVNEDNLFLGSEENLAYTSRVFENFYVKGFQPLSKDFNFLGKDLSAEGLQQVKYLINTDKVISPGSNLHLETEYRIWDPKKSFSFGPVSIHYYSLMFIIAFGLGYWIFSRIYRREKVNEKYLEPLFTLTLLGTIFGARLGHVIFYQPELFKQDFWSVFLPIQTKPEFKFTGFSGLASHGAAIALIGTTLYYAFKIIKKNPLWVCDRIGLVVALGGGFVRLGNFFNSEIIGKPVASSSPFAVLFPQMSDEYGLTVPRYPTQLFEAFGYFCLFLVLWLIYRFTGKKYQQGWLFGFFFLVLWSIRFVVEFLKEPQGEEFITFGGLNTGQVLSLPFMLAGLAVLIMSRKFPTTPEETAKPEYPAQTRER